MGRKKLSKKRRAREKKEAARSGMTVEQLRQVKEHGTGRGVKRNTQAAGITGYADYERFRKGIE